MRTLTCPKRAHLGNIAPEMRAATRLPCRQGYEERVARSGVTGPRGSMDFHAIGATMEDVGKNVMANMSGISSSSSMCAKVVAGEGHTLTKVRLHNASITRRSRLACQHVFTRYLQSNVQ